MANDEEYAEALAAAWMDKSEPAGQKGPRLTEWTPEARLLSAAINELRILNAAFVMANSPREAQKPKPEMMPTPTTAIQRALANMKRARREAKHQSLVARVLPHKKRPADGSVSPD